MNAKWELSTGPATFDNGVNVTWSWGGAALQKLSLGSMGSVVIMGETWSLVNVTSKLLYRNQYALDCKAFYGAGPGQKGSANLTAGGDSTSQE